MSKFPASSSLSCMFPEVSQSKMEGNLKYTHTNTLAIYQNKHTYLLTKNQLTNQHFIHNDAQTPPITKLVIPILHKHFWSDVVRGSNSGESLKKHKYFVYYFTSDATQKTLWDLIDYTRVHRNPSMVLLQSSTPILRTRSFHNNFLKHCIYLYPPTVCRTVLGQEETLTNCLLFRFHVSAFLFEFMFWNAEEKNKSKVTATKSAMQPLHYFIYNTIKMFWVSHFFFFFF